MKGTALHEAVFAGHTNVATYLIQKGINLCAKDVSGNTALHLACKQDDIVMTKTLLKFITTPKPFTIKDYKEKTPLDVAKGYLKDIVKGKLTFIIIIIFYYCY